MMTDPGVCLLMKEKHGVGKPTQEEDNPWECTIYRGELVIEIPEKDRPPNQQGRHPDNYHLYYDHSITLYAAPLEVTPLTRDELKYLIAVYPPSVRIQQYLNEKRLKEIMEIKKGDMVMFKFKIEQTAPDSIIRGKVQYLGHLEEKDGIYFGIEIMVSIINTIVNILVNICRIKSNEVEVVLMVDHILIVVTIMLYM